jgi:ATP-dependent DNA helicase PIF1
MKRLGDGSSSFSRLLRRKKESKFQQLDELDGTIQSLWNLICKHQFVLVSGRAGTGKSYLLRTLLDLLVQRCPNISSTVVAPTAVAAVNANGTTLHSWLSMGLANEPLHVLLDKLRTGRFKRTYLSIRSTDILLIDEISMVCPLFFEKISAICAEVLGGSRKPFGTLKIVFFGDFLQLPPITRSKTMKFVFQTPLWQTMDVQRMMLRHVYRQKDPLFLRVLNRVRLGIVDQHVRDMLLPRFGTPQKTDIFTRLCSYRSTVDAFNSNKLDELPTRSYRYRGSVRIERQVEKQRISSDDQRKAEALLSKGPLDKYFTIPIDTHFKEGAAVMCRTNAFLETHNTVNGSLGRVQALSADSIIVQFENGSLFNIERVDFTHKVGETARVVLNQFPITLAYAMSIHKSQGVTLTRALISTNCFEEGQFYVAISRLTTLSGLFLTGDKTLKCVKANPFASRFEADEILLLFLIEATFATRGDSAIARVFRTAIADRRVFHHIFSFLF